MKYKCLHITYTHGTIASCILKYIFWYSIMHTNIFFCIFVQLMDKGFLSLYVRIKCWVFFMKPKKRFFFACSPRAHLCHMRAVQLSLTHLRRACRVTREEKLENSVARPAKLYDSLHAKLGFIFSRILVSGWSLENLIAHGTRSPLFISTRRCILQEKATFSYDFWSTLFTS